MVKTRPTVKVTLEDHWEDGKNFRAAEREIQVEENVVKYKPETIIEKTVQTRKAKPSVNLFLKEAERSLTPTAENFLTDARRLVAEKLRTGLQVS